MRKAIKIQVPNIQGVAPLHAVRSFNLGLRVIYALCNDLFELQWQQNTEEKTFSSQLEHTWHSDSDILTQHNQTKKVSGRKNSEFLFVHLFRSR